MGEIVTDEAVKDGYAAYQRAWVTRNQSNPLFAEHVVRDVLEAAAPRVAAAERKRLRVILLHDPVMLADPVAIAKLLREDSP